MNHCVLAASLVRFNVFRSLSKEIRVRSLRILPVIGAAALALAACTGGSAPADSTASPEATRPAATVLNVYAAASLTETFGELEDIFEEANPGVDVRFNFAGPSRTSSPSSAKVRTSTSWPPPTSPP